jgi:GSH-dependent disulfide-bond oxidoreductase
LAGREFLAGDYSIADMAAYPWIVPHARQGQKLEDTPHLKRWFEAIQARAGTLLAYAKAAPYAGRPAVTEEGKKLLFGQTAASVAR